MGLLEDLQEASINRSTAATCSLCVLIDGTEDETTKEALREAASGTMGEHKLVAVLAKNGTGIGRRTIHRHRAEGHL